MHVHTHRHNFRYIFFLGAHPAVFTVYKLVCYWMSALLSLWLPYRFLLHLLFILFSSFALDLVVPVHRLFLRREPCVSLSYVGFCCFRVVLLDHDRDLVVIRE